MSDTIDQSDQGRDATVEHPVHQPQDVRKELWLDLEDTIVTPVVNGWFNTEAINIDKVKRFISEFKPDLVHIFSFAIWDVAQREQFNIATRPWLEEALGVKFSLVLTVDDDMIPICCKLMGLSHDLVDFQEMSNFWGKQGTFRLCMRHHATNLQKHNLQLHAVLLDDVVYNEHLVWSDIGAAIQQLNIDQLYVTV